MNEELALRKAIAAYPEEDTPRLAYADWLDDHAGAKGAARAEFIRVQISLASKRDVIKGRPWTDDLEQEFKDRERELLRDHRGIFVEELTSSIDDLHWSNIELVRGFPEALYLCNSASTQLEQRASISETSTILRLTISEQNLTDDDLVHIAPLTQLKELDMNLNEITDAGMVHLTGLSNLRKLDISFTDVTHEGIRTLALSPYLSPDLEIDHSSVATLGELRIGLGMEPNFSHVSTDAKPDTTWANRTAERTPRTLT
jgi:uncharacterized protein (TIGR02996 family)